jgi:hypothetical protein
MERPKLPNASAHHLLSKLKTIGPPVKQRKGRFLCPKPGAAKFSPNERVAAARTAAAAAAIAFAATAAAVVAVDAVRELWEEYEVIEATIVAYDPDTSKHQIDPDCALNLSGAAIRPRSGPKKTEWVYLKNTTYSLVRPHTECPSEKTTWLKNLCSGTHGNLLHQRANNNLLHLWFWDIFTVLLCVLLWCGMVAFHFLSESADESIDTLKWEYSWYPEWKVKADVYWLRCVYALLSFPFVIFKLPPLSLVLTHARPTGYTRTGRCVPMKKCKRVSEDGTTKIGDGFVFTI